VRVNDRGPFLHDRLIDLSYAGAAKLGILGTGTGIVEVEAILSEESTVQVAQSQKPVIEIIPSALAAENLPRPVPISSPKLYLQVGAFSQWDNATNLRARLQRETERPIFIQSALVPNERAPDAVRLYRVRIGPLANVEEGDLLSERVTQLGITDTRIVVE
jgi:rare lipoprotein A